MNKWTRRGFIGAGVLSGGALVVGVALRPGNPIGELAGLVAKDEGEQLINSWVKIDADNVVTAIVPHTEMGQGVLTTLAQMLADEMDADWDKVSVMSAPATGDYVSQHMARAFVAPGTLDAAPWLEPTLDGFFTRITRLADGYATGGSFSVRSTGQKGMRTAGAAARQMLVAAAAVEWGVPAGEIETENSILSHPPSGKTATYASFSAAAAQQTLPTNPVLKDPTEFNLMGTPAARKDIPAKVDGTEQYGIDAIVPGQQLMHAAVLAPPVFGATVEKVDDSTAKSMPGVQQVLNLGDFVAVVADGYWQAQQALNNLDITFSETENDGLGTDGLFARYTSALDAAGNDGGTVLAESGDVSTAYENAATKVESEYRVPFLAHATMEPVNCTAWVRDGVADIWSGLQVPLRGRTEISNAIGIDAENITMHQMSLGGGFGRRLRDDYAVMGARIAQAAGVPVKTIWSREEDIQKAYYRNSTISRFKGGLDQSGNLVSWDNLFLYQQDPHDAAMAAHYQLPNQSTRVLSDVSMHLRFGDWRSVDASYQGFFIESFVDELAFASGKDPVAFRLSLLDQSPRYAAVLRGAAEMSNWGSALPANHGRGIALFQSFGTIVAEVAEVDMTDGTPKVTKVFCCADPGYAMNPDGFVSQMESCIIFGLTATLYGEITLKDGAVEQSNFHDYRMLRMNETPEIAVQIVNGDANNLGGGGEPGLPPVAPAVTNAIFAATGHRVRELPLAKQNFA